MALHHIKKCPECGGINLFWNKEKGEVICKDCGLVVEDKMVDFEQEWREFDSEDADKRRRTGAPMSYLKHENYQFIFFHIKNNPIISDSEPITLHSDKLFDITGFRPDS